MPLPRIPSNNPIIVPASEAKEFTDLYITYLRLIKAGNNHRLDVTLHPYNYDTNEFGDGANTNFNIPDVFTEAARVPLLATVMGGIIQVTSLLIQEKDLVKQIASASDEDKPALQESLTAIRTAMGIS